MVRNFRKETTKGSTPPDVMLRAVREVKLKNRCLRTVAREFTEYGLNYRTLARYCKKITDDELRDEKLVTPSFSVGYTKSRQVFNEAAEQQLVKYIIQASNIYFGLSPKEIRCLAFQLAQVNSLSMPNSWKENKIAGTDWFTYFSKRHPTLSIRKPRSTSLALATSFNKTNVQLFYKKLQSLMERYKFESHEIWNMDETGVTSMQTLDRVVTRRDCRQVGGVVSAERRTLITIACAISAIGNNIPPFFIFPEVHFKDHFIAHGPPGSAGSANPSGWLEESDFLLFLKHFHKHVKSSSKNPCLLILDNYGSHLSIESLNFSKENGIVMLSFPSHCSHKLQPLDKAIFGPFKKYVNSACDDWIISKPEKMMTIYDIPEVIATAYPLIMTPSNIQSGFRNTGIFPFNENAFTNQDSLSSFVTDMPPPKEEPDLSQEKDKDYGGDPIPSSANADDDQVSEPDSTPGCSKWCNPILSVSPFHICPFPKAGVSINHDKQDSRKRNSPILMDFPIKKERLEEE